MTDFDDTEKPTSYASPACYMHEVDSKYMGLGDVTGNIERANIMRWRKSERERLIKQRLALSADIRGQYAKQIAAVLESTIGEIAGCVISAYWPFRGEPDLRELLKRLTARGGRTALPVVIAHGQPLIFRAWTTGDPIERGVWNIPVPTNAADVVEPDVVIVPVVGFDRNCYRLGYGGGFFDRTLAAARKKPRILGVGYRQAAIATIHPLAHDIPMDMIVLPEGIISKPVANNREIVVCKRMPIELNNDSEK